MCVCVGGSVYGVGLGLGLGTIKVRTDRSFLHWGLQAPWGALLCPSETQTPTSRAYLDPKNAPFQGRIQDNRKKNPEKKVISWGLCKP